MKPREHNGKTYLPVTQEQLIPLERLRCNLYVFLALNNRMVRIRERDQLLDEDQLRAYTNQGHPCFYMLDPGTNPGSYDFQDQESPQNPRIDEALAKTWKDVWELAKGKQRGEEEGAILAKPERSADESEASKIGASHEPEENAQAFASGRETEESTRVGGKTADDDAAAKVAGSEKTPEEEERLKGSSDSEDENRLGADAKGLEAEQKFGGDPKGLEAEKKLGADPKGLETNQQFGANGKGAEEQMRFGTAAEGAGGMEQHFGKQGEGDAGISKNSLGTGAAAGKGFGKEAEAPVTEERFKAEVVPADQTKRVLSADKKEAVREGLTLAKAGNGPEGEAAKRDQVLVIAKDMAAGRDSAGTGTFEKTFKAEEEELARQADVVSFSRNTDGLDKYPSTWVNRLQDKPDKTSALDKEIQTIEARLARISPEEKAFVEELHRPNAPVPEDPEARAAFRLNQHLGLLRGEAAATVSVKPRSFGEKSELTQRRRDLKEEIAKFEATTAILEHLDGVATDMPDELVGRSKADLVQRLEKNINEMRNTVVLDEQAYQALAKRVQSVKAADPEIGGAQVQKVAQALAVALGEEKLTPEKIAQLQKQAVRDVKNAKASAEISEQLVELRQELGDLIEVEAKTPAEQAELEKKAASLQSEIQRLEELNVAIESGEGLPEEELKKLLRGEEQPVALKFGESPEQGLNRLLGELGSLEENVVEKKKEASAAEAQLKEKILSPPQGAKGLPDLPPTQEELAKAPHLEAFEKAREKLQEVKDVLEKSGREVRPEQVEALQKAVSREIQKAEAVVRVDTKLSAAQAELEQLIEGGEEELDETEREVRTVLLQKDIQNLQTLRRDLQTGKAVEPAKLASLGRSVAETPVQSVDQLLQQITNLESKGAKATAKVIRTEEALSRTLGLSADPIVKQRAVNTAEIDQVGKKMSRFLKEFVETGKAPNAEAVWEINHAVAQAVRNAETSIHISQAISAKTKEHQELLAADPGKVPSTKNLAKAKELKEEIWKLTRLARDVERGMTEQQEACARYFAQLKDYHFFKGDIPPEEPIRHFLGELEQLKATVVSSKVEALECAAQVLKRGGSVPEPKGAYRVFQGGKADHRKDSELRVRSGKEKAADVPWRQLGGEEADEAKRGVRIFQGAKADHRVDEKRNLISGGAKREEAVQWNFSDGKSDAGDSEPIRVYQGAKADHRTDEEIRVPSSQAQPGASKEEPVPWNFGSPEGAEGGAKSAVPWNTTPGAQPSAGRKVSDWKVHEGSWDAAAPEDESVRVFSGAKAPPEPPVRVVSEAEDQRRFQAAVYAATWLRAIGYRDEELEKNLLLACLLAPHTAEEVRRGFPEGVAELHRIEETGGDPADMRSREIAQAVQMAYRYVDLPEVVSGTYAFRPEVLDPLCAELSKDKLDPLDAQMLERARQSVAFGFAANQRDELVDLAKYNLEKLNRWKQEGR